MLRYFTCFVEWRDESQQKEIKENMSVTANGDPHIAEKPYSTSVSHVGGRGTVANSLSELKL